MDNKFLLTILISAVTSVIAVRWIFFKILKIAKEKNLVDNPEARKLQKKPIPVVGGLAVFFGLIFGILAGSVSLHLFCPDLLESSLFYTTTRILPLILCLGIVLYAGCLDDIIGLSHRSRFVIEILAILGLVYSSEISIDSLHGLWGIGELPQYVSVPLTIFAGVGIINAINMVDGVNGLSSGLCITYCILFACQFALAGDYANTLVAVSMAASSLLFFIHNVFGDQSRMFIGDAGTMVIGTMMTWFVMCTMHNGQSLSLLSHDICPAAMLVAFLSVPVADTLRVMTLRMLNGKSPFRPDKTHLHHAFVGMGVSHSITSLSEIVINISVVGAWYVSVLLGAPFHCQLYLVILLSGLLVWGTYFFLCHEHTSRSRVAHWLRYVSEKTHFGSTRWWQSISYRLDAPERDERDSSNLRERLLRKFGNGI